MQRIAVHCSKTADQGPLNEAAAKAVAKAVSSAHTTPSVQEAALIAKWLSHPSAAGYRDSVELVQAANALCKAISRRPNGLVDSVAMCHHGAELVLALDWALSVGALGDMGGLDHAARSVGKSIARRVLAQLGRLQPPFPVAGPQCEAVERLRAPQVPAAHLAAVLAAAKALAPSRPSSAPVAFACLAALVREWQAACPDSPANGAPSEGCDAVWELLTAHRACPPPGSASAGALAAAMALRRPPLPALAALLAVLSAADLPEAPSAADAHWRGRASLALSVLDDSRAGGGGGFHGGGQTALRASLEELLSRAVAAVAASPGGAASLWAVARQQAPPTPTPSGNGIPSEASASASRWAEQAAVRLARALLAAREARPGTAASDARPGAVADAPPPEGTAAGALQALLAPLMPPSAATAAMWADAVGAGTAGEGAGDAAARGEAAAPPWEALEAAAQAASGTAAVAGRAPDQSGPQMRQSPPATALLAALSGEDCHSLTEAELVRAARQWALEHSATSRRA